MKFARINNVSAYIVAGRVNNLGYLLPFKGLNKLFIVRKEQML